MRRFAPALGLILLASAGALAHAPTPGGGGGGGGRPRIAPANQPPELELPPYRMVPPGMEVSFGLNVVDQDADTVVVEVVDKPAGAVYDPVTLTVTWKPTARDAPAGRFRVKLTEIQRQGGARRSYLHDFSIAVVKGARPETRPQPLGPAVELLITIHDPERLAQVNRDWPLLTMLEQVEKIERGKLPDAERGQVAPAGGRRLYEDALAALALRHGNERVDPRSPRFDNKAFGDPSKWRITAVRPRLDKDVQELRIVYENAAAPEPVYLMFRWRLVREVAPGELPGPEVVDFQNAEFTRLTYEAFFVDGKLNPKFFADRKAHGKAVSEFVGRVVSYASDKYPHLGADLAALPHEARLGGGSARDERGGYASGDGWAWAVLRPRWEGEPRRLTMVSVPIPGFTTDVRPNADSSKWLTVCAPKFDPEDKRYEKIWGKICRKKLGFTDLPWKQDDGTHASSPIDAANLFVEFKRGDMVALVDLRDPRRDLFEENGMTCSQCHVRDFANGDVRDPAIRDPRVGRLPAASPTIPTTFFNLVPEETWRPYMIEFQKFQECRFREAFRRYKGVETDLTCPLKAEE